MSDLDELAAATQLEYAAPRRPARRGSVSLGDVSIGAAFSFGFWASAGSFVFSILLAAIFFLAWIIARL